MFNGLVLKNCALYIYICVKNYLKIQINTQSITAFRMFVPNTEKT